MITKKERLINIKRFKYLIVYLTGAILLTLTQYVFHNYYVYSCWSFLENIVNKPYAFVISGFIEIAIYLSIGTFTILNVYFEKDKLYIIKKILVFIASVIILNTIYKVIFYLSWIILTGIYGY